MAKQVRSVEFLPEIFRTPVNEQFLSATLDQLIQNPRYSQTQGFIGRRIGPGVNANNKYVVEPTKTRTNYQLEPGVIQVDPENTGRVVDAITYPGLADALQSQGAFVNNADRLYTSDYYAWDPFVDFDKLVNYAQYYWLPGGPLAVDVGATGVPLTDSFTVTRANGVYTFSGVEGSNPVITLVRGGSYTFDVAQNASETVNYRVSNNGSSSWSIDYEANPTLTLVRGNTYVFNLTPNIPWSFYIKTQPTLGTTNVYDNGVFNNGARAGLITFTVPQDAPDTLYYANDTQMNLQGQLNIVDGTPGTGPGFWIQTDPGISGRIPVTPNISSRDVLGVENNGEDLGTVTFNVPLATAQNFYYNMPSLGTVDLITNLQFDQINNVPVSVFLETYGGIDGITNLNGRTLVFQYTNEGWEQTVLDDPFTFIPITDPAIRYSIWQAQYNLVDDVEYIQLTSIEPVDPLNKFTIGFGDVYSSTNWYKNDDGYFEQMPLLTADKSLLFYQDGTDPEIFGQIRIIDPELSTTIDVDSIIGSPNYTSPNGVVFSNGMKVVFRGNVIPSSYQNNEYYVEGVGSAIKLIATSSFVTPETYTQNVNIPYDTAPYDFGNYDASLNQPLTPDYLTVNRASPDLNAWCRSNRWFHIDVIQASADYNNTTPLFDNNFRARRPILEFRAGTKLYDYGTQGLPPVNIVDLTQTDALSNVNGAISYNTDGYSLVNGSTIVFAADLDPEVRRTVYSVQFVVTDTNAEDSTIIDIPVIVLTPVYQASANDIVVCLNGLTCQGISYYYDGVNWIEGQQKRSVNQPPLFDIYDSNGVSFGNREIYRSSNFNGSPLFSYAIGDAAPDLVLGFPLTYLSLTNIGDIVFDNNFYKDSFTYTLDNVGQTVPLSTGFVRQYENRTSFQREIGWQTAITSSLVRQQFQFTYDGGPLLLDVAVNNNTTVPAVQIFINGIFQESYNYVYTVGTNTTTINLLTTYVPGDLVEVAVLSDQVSVQGFYQVPINLGNNPFNGNSEQFTLGTIRNHYVTIAQNLIDLSGPPVGANNTRDLGNIVPYGLQILQQSSPLTLTGYFMREPDYNIFASLAYNSAEYIKFKSQLLTTVTTFGIADYGNWTTAKLLDECMVKITAGRTNLNPFYWSDMLPTGPVFTSNSYTVTAITTNKFNTVQTYDFRSSNYEGLCVYVNNAILTRGYGYVVSTEGPTLTILVPLAVGDVVTINEYSNTAGNFVPNTPTKLGLYPKYEPRFYYDTNYVNPTWVIQGHDGSISVAFGTPTEPDPRDAVLLEFETRVYSNLKNDDNPPPLVAEDVIPGYFRTTGYSQQEITQILGENFLIWAGANKLDYTTQNYLADNEFTYNYSQAGNRLDQQPLLGAWRGIYRYFYDTLSPSTTPWEMLGFSEEPAWWRDRYGPTPYTSDNLVLWGDLEAGLVADPVAPYVIPKYRRPGLTNAIPVNDQGELLSPFYAVMGAYNPQGFQKSWQVGDGGPVEASWWMSSSYPFAVMRLLILTRPAEFFSLFADRDLYKYSAEFDQYLYNGRYRIEPKNIEVYGNGVSKASYINWIVDYNQQLGINSTDALTTDLDNLDVRLCYRMASFVAGQNLTVNLEKSAPQSQNTSLQVPPESYNLLLYKNQPFNRINYSAVIVEVVEGGYQVYGYSTADPYFSVVASKVTGLTQTITAGNVSVTVPSQYTDQVVQVPYGYTFTNLAGVVDFMLGYGQYLIGQGLQFVTQENGLTLNWLQMAQEFLYFANQGWAVGTIINLNPSASQIVSFRAGAVVDSIVTYTPENLVLDQNRQAVNARNMIIYRQGNVFKLNPEPGGDQTISFLRLQFTDYENMIVFDNRTIFNDLIYDTITAERQSRLGLIASTSTEWNGTLNAQGFILNQDNVRAWKPNTKYTKGDIVIYKNSYWQANTVVQPKTKFDFADWLKSNYDLIEQGLLQNIATKADQLATSYDTQTANLGIDNDLLAFGLIGFRPRQYMADLNLSDTSQVQLYQQFIKTMGSLNATDLFTRVNFNNVVGQYNIYETWGILVGTYGAQANRSWFEVLLDEAQLTGNPSTLQIIQPGQESEANQTVLLNKLWAESYAIPDTNILPVTYTRNPDTALPSAGYVNINDVDITVFNLNNPANIASNLGNIGNGTSIWVAQDNSYNWNIYRCEQVSGRITQIVDNLNGTSRAQFSTTVDLDVGDVIIIRFFSDAVDGVYRVLSRPTIDTVVIGYEFTNTNQTTIAGNGIAFYLQTMRVSQASDIGTLPYAAQLTPGATVWVDNDGSGHWQVLEKTNPFSPIDTLIPGNLENNSLFGSSMAQSKDHYALLVGAPAAAGGSGAVYTYRISLNNNYVDNTELTLSATDTVGYGNSVDFGDRTWAVAGASASNSGAGYATVLYLIPGSSNWVQTQLLVAPDQDFTAIGFGSSVKISSDERWMYISAPGANRVYAFARIDVPRQTKAYTTDGVTRSFNYSNFIMIDSTYPDQMLVLLNNTLLTPGLDYTLTADTVEFATAIPANNTLTLLRRDQVQFYSGASHNLTDYLYTATDYDSITVLVDGVLLRPYIDYTFVGGVLTLLVSPGNVLSVQSANVGAYWKYVDTISAMYVDAAGDFGSSITTDAQATQILIGAPNDSAPDANGDIIDNAGAVYAFDRSVVKIIITDPAQLTYAIPGTYADPINVVLNNQYLTNTDTYIDGQFTITAGNVVLSSSVTPSVGDVLEIETNQFQLVQKFAANTVIDESQFGHSIDICSNSCSVYVGAPYDSNATGVVQAGMVQRRVNQSRIYGITTSTIANPVLTPGDTIRINNIEISVPNSPDNTVLGLIDAINLANVPNARATAVPDVILTGDAVTKTFTVGNVYSAASAYTPVVYVDDVLQIETVDYTYNNSLEQISFVLAPAYGATITVVAGRMTLTVINIEAAEEFNKLTVLPGVAATDSTIGTAFYDLGFVTYLYTQTITSPAPTDYAFFGSSLSVNTGAVNLVVGAPNGNVYEPTTFDSGETYFDATSTTFFGYVNNSGVVFTFDYLPSSTSTANNPGKFVFGQQVYVTNLVPADQFGAAVNYRDGRLLVGVPGNDLGDSSVNYGSVVVLDNPTDAPVWQATYTQQPMVDVNLINSVYSFNKLLNSTQTYFDYIDPLQGKILGVARRNIDYIGAVDPASYNTGSVHNLGTSWGPSNLGQIWWDTNSVRFIDANQDNLTYASRRWGQVFPGSTVDIYQWTASSVSPANYTGPGTPFSTSSFTVRSGVDDQGLVTTTYYFWVRGISTVTTQYGKTLSPVAIATYILNPLSSGLPYMAPLAPNAIALYNAGNLLSATDTVLHVEYDRQARGGDNDIHTEYEFIAENKANEFLNPNLYRKFLDSYCGTTTTGAAVPDPLLSPGMQYGVQFRPRQSMFIDRFRALENYLGHCNAVLAQHPISETRSFNLLNSGEPIPAPNTGAWNAEVPNLEILGYQDLALVSVGYRYLVLTDSTLSGRWSIYVVDNGALPGQKVLNLAQVQNYDTPLYWNYINWYRPGYNSSVTPVATVPNTAGLQTLSFETAPMGSSVKVTANGQGKFEIYQRTDLGWERVGLEDGTIQISSVLWNYPSGGYGFDAEVFDANFFDQAPNTETRYIIRAINEELFVDDLLIERNRALMLTFKFIYSEFTSPSWLIKTSYINVDHVVRGLYPYELYTPDNQTFVLDYLNEVKPYHVQTLSFNLIYDGLDTYQTNLTDFDVPAYWDTALDFPEFVSPVLLPYDSSGSVRESFNSDAASDAQIWLERPWSDWYNAYLLQVQGANVIDGGSGYTVPPTVVVTGDAVTPAELTATINSAGRVVALQVVYGGSGYTTTPTITFTGGNGSGAVAAPIMDNNLVRSIKTTIKYDRCEYQSTIYQWQANVVYNQGERVRYANRVWSANATQATATFLIDQWTVVPASELNGADRTMGYYTPDANMPGLSLPLLIDGIDYPGVQVDAPDFNQDTGFDVGNYDINPFDNISYDETGAPTYDPSILDVRYSNYYGNPNISTSSPWLDDSVTGIIVAGGGYIDTYSSHAPEELVPGSEFDTLDLRVYTTPGSDWLGRGHGFPAGVRRYVYDSSNPVLNFEGILDFPVTVILFNATWGLALEPLSYNWANYELTVDPATATDGDVFEIYVTGVGGGNQLLNASYLGSEIIDGDKIVIPFPTSYDPLPPIDSIYEFLIYNGEVMLEPGVDYNYAPADPLIYGENKTLVSFTSTYGATDRLNLTAFGYGYTGTTYSWSLPVFQTIVVTNPTQLSYTLTNSLQGTNPVNLIVTVDGVRARPSEGVKYIADGSSTTFALPTRGGYSQGLIVDNDVSVYVDNQAQILGVDFIVDPWDGSSDRNITFLMGPPAEGSAVLISVRTAAQYWVLGDQLLFRPSLGLRPTLGQIIEIVTWNDTREQDLLTSVFVGPTTEGVLIQEGYDSTDYSPVTINNTPGSYDFSTGTQTSQNIFDTGRVITNPDRILVSLNGNWLFSDIDYVVQGQYLIILGPLLPVDAVLAVTSFTQSVVPGSMAFRIFQDMRGVQATYRITPATTTFTTDSVSALDDVIYVANAAALPEPNFEVNIWGVITINAERIMYRERDTINNTVSGLLRGTAGTAATSHALGATVYSLGRGNLLPQDQDYIDANSFLGDNSTIEYTTDIVVDNRPLAYIGGRVEVRLDGTLVDPSLYTLTQVEPIAVRFNSTPTLGVQVRVTVIYLDDTTTFQEFTATGFTVNFVTSMNIGLELQPSNTYTLDDFNPVTITFDTPPPEQHVVYIRNQRGAEDEFEFSIADGFETTFTTTIDLSIPVRVYLGGIEQDPATYQVTSLDPVIVLFDVPPPSGVEVTILVRLGQTWYQRGLTTPSNGEPLQTTDTTTARFLRGQ